MLYTVSIRNHDDKLIEVVVDNQQILLLCHLLENSSTVINFKVSRPGSILSQDKFGVGGFKKWVILNF